MKKIRIEITEVWEGKMSEESLKEWQDKYKFPKESGEVDRISDQAWAVGIMIDGKESVSKEINVEIKNLEE